MKEILKNMVQKIHKECNRRERKRKLMSMVAMLCVFSIVTTSVMQSSMIPVSANYRTGSNAVYTSSNVATPSNTDDGSSSGGTSVVTPSDTDVETPSNAQVATPSNADPEDFLICEQEVHVHLGECYNYSEELDCEINEHVHDENCYDGYVPDEKDYEAIDEIIELIMKLPTYEEIDSKLATYDEEEDYDGYENYFLENKLKFSDVYARYEALHPSIRTYVTNRDELFDMSWIWSSMTFAETRIIDVTAINNVNPSAVIILYNSSGVTATHSGYGNYAWWDVIKVEKENGIYRVKEVRGPDGTGKGDVSATGNGFIVVIHSQSGVDPIVSVGDVVAVSSDGFWTENRTYTGAVWGTLNFQPKKAEKDNLNNLSIIDSADTSEFIELNLYDYGSGSTGLNINATHNANNNLPGFQQNGGTSDIASLAKFQSTGYLNLGDIVTDDPNSVDGKSITSGSPTLINQTTMDANAPISKVNDVMHEELINGYPALADKTSLSYLFGQKFTDNKQYSVKKNTANINGLFQYNKETGEYHFNSREEFAQFDNSTNSFTLYDQIFTPNFIMYPFGNFMPFNDIVKDSKQVSQINEAYFEELMKHANYLAYSATGYTDAERTRFATLGKVLGQIIDYAEQDGWGSEWTAARALQHYFYYGSLTTNVNNKLPDLGSVKDVVEKIDLENMYNLDYDVESNFYFGMEMKMRFMQPKNGRTGNSGNEPMIFYFTGDDDVWVYVDDKLFLDLSGIHRHVGGKIDFEKGLIYYYPLDTSIGDVSSTPYKVVHFSDLVQADKLKDAVDSDGSAIYVNNLGEEVSSNTSGAIKCQTFKNYSEHDFNFYYMERGSGSSVCRLNFNFPLLKRNTITVEKELDSVDSVEALGNPDFKFQILEADSNGTKTENLFIAANTTYKVYDVESNTILDEDAVTDENGIIVLKAGQRAEFSDIQENSGKYYVRELLDPAYYAQYKDIAVEGSSVTKEKNVTVGTSSFVGLESTVVDASDGGTKFKFINTLNTNLGSLKVSKVLSENETVPAGTTFKFNVKLDGENVAEGTKYKVGSEERSVSADGVISLAPGEEAVFENIIAGTPFSVSEIEKYYHVGYTCTDDSATIGSDKVTGTIQYNTQIIITATNTAKKASIDIPFEKILTNADGNEHTYTIKLEKVEGDNTTEVERKTVTFSSEGTDLMVSDVFTLSFLSRDFKDVSTPITYYYKVSELDTDSESVDCDETVYDVTVTITLAADGALSLEKTISKESGPVDKVSFTNTLLSSVTIQKEVTGSLGDRSKQFDFTATAEAGTFVGGNIEISGGCEFEVNDEGSQITFKLAHGNELTINKLPVGTEITVTENYTQGENETIAYVVTAKQGNTTGTGSQITSTIAASNEDIIFTNHKEARPDTGILLDSWPYLLILVIALAGIVGFVIHKRKETDLD